MLKRIVCFLLATVIVAGILAGCSEIPAETTGAAVLETTLPPSSDSTEGSSPTQPGVATEATEATEETEPAPEPLPPEESRPVQPAEDPINPGTKLSDTPNTENGVFASCGNYYYTLYLGWTEEVIKFYIITENPLPEGSKIQTNLQSVTQTYIKKLDDLSVNLAIRLFDDGQHADFNWATYWQLEKALYDSIESYNAGKCSYSAVQAAYDAHVAYDARLASACQPEFLQAMQDYKNGKELFHVYEVKLIMMRYAADEELTQVELVAGDMSRTIPVGLIRLRQKMDPTTEKINSLTMKNILYTLASRNKADTLSEPWHAGVQAMTWGFTAQRDMTLTDAYFFANGGEDCKIVGAEVELIQYDKKGNKIGERLVTWSPGMPLEIKKNEKVTCWVYYEDPLTQMAEYCAKRYMVLEYNCEGTVGRLLSSRDCLRTWSSWFEQYRWGLKNFNAESFYKDYLQPQTQYRQEHNGKLPAMPRPAG